MRQVFADSFYWIALIDPDDAFHARVRELGASFGSIRLATSEPVLIEVLNHFSGYGSYWRNRAAALVEGILLDPRIQVVAYDMERTLWKALEFYGSRPDKQYSMVDCISMCAMKDLSIYEVLTGDHHFRQEGFTLLL